ncbi:MAG TPA: hypothetical protein DCK98_15535 [Chloroflexi bacterium]|nr:hypothetical protein [Chloroflexota bacterium]HAL28564.1 hypothetical protein [Chloroflexota bacterium]
MIGRHVDDHDARAPMGPPDRRAEPPQEIRRDARVGRIRGSALGISGWQDRAGDRLGWLDVESGRQRGGAALRSGRLFPKHSN